MISALPRVGRPDSAAVLIGQWTAPDPEQRAIAAGLLGALWSPEPEGCLDQALFADDDSVLSYSQWVSPEAAARFVATASVGEVLDRAGVPGGDPVEYRLYRSERENTEETPGCVVLGQIDFDGPDHERLRAWVDAMFAVDDGGEPVPGLISAHFHLSADGTRVRNYAEWSSAAAHRAFFEAAPAAEDESEDLREAHTWSGIVGGGVRRYQPWPSIVTL